MSAKWRRAKDWDRKHLRGPVLMPVRWVLHAFSSISLAVVLLTLVGVYGLLASVPIGLLAQAPTWAVICLTLLVMVGMTATIAAIGARASVPRPHQQWRFTLTVVGGIVGSIVAAWAWHRWAWPALQYDPTSDGGVRFFADFVSRYESTTLRRLPGIELTELEFYSAWPLRIILVMFVVNMIVATVRRIDFSFSKIGVLTVHTGIVVIALGSVYYQVLKQEGDTILLAGPRSADGTPTPGPPQRMFHDGTRMALTVSQHRGESTTEPRLEEQRSIRGLPRYNAYGLLAAQRAQGALLSNAFADTDDVSSNDTDRSLSIDLPAVPGVGAIDPGIELRVVGYAPYAVLREDVRLLTREQFDRDMPGRTPRPIREIELVFPTENTSPSDRPALRFTLAPDDPVRRRKSTPAFAIEMTRGTTDARWADLMAVAPAGATDLLVVEPAGTGARAVIPGRPGEAYTIGRTGWEVAVRAFEPEPPFPIITPGYENASSSVAILRVTRPDGTTYDRWVYSRFPEISQDFLPPSTPGARPVRRDADPEIRVAYVDRSRGLGIHLDELTPTGSDHPRWRAVVQSPDGSVRTIENIERGSTIADVAPGVDLVIRAGWAHGEPVERPVIIPEAEREARFVGTHDVAAIAVEVRTGASHPESAWARIVWVPFTRYAGLSRETLREVDLPDGRRLTLAFGREQRRFPGFALRLMDFEMLAYDHRGAPRDYQSLIRVVPEAGFGSLGPYERVAKLNAPLRAPFAWDGDRSWLANVAMRTVSGLRPNQYKISQAGWDQAGWSETRALADQGLIPEPYARFTIMQVGNNPGIHVIALGGVMIGLGIPWAFYVTPWLLRRKKSRLAAAHAR